MKMLYVIVRGAGEWIADIDSLEGGYSCTECLWIVPGTWNDYGDNE